MASTISKNKKAAAVKALYDAEAFFKLRKLDSAIKEATQAKNLDPSWPNVDNFITAYKIHRAMSLKKNWYVVLDIPECSHLSIIKQRFRALALMVHPDKNHSAAAEDAFKHAKDALDFLSDPVRKEDYDRSFMWKYKAFATAAKKPETTAEARKAAEAAFTTEAAEKKRKAAAKAAENKRKAAAKAAEKKRKAAADAAAFEFELAAAKRKLAAENATASKKAAEAADKLRKAAETAAASRKAAEAAASAAAKEAAAAAARRAINARKRREPMSELEHGIHLIMKYSPNYMERRFSVR